MGNSTSKDFLDKKYGNRSHDSSSYPKKMKKFKEKDKANSSFKTRYEDINENKEENQTSPGEKYAKLEVPIRTITKSRSNLDMRHLESRSSSSEFSESIRSISPNFLNRSPHSNRFCEDFHFGGNQFKKKGMRGNGSEELILYGNDQLNDFNFQHNPVFHEEQSIPIEPRDTFSFAAPTGCDELVLNKHLPQLDLNLYQFENDQDQEEHRYISVRFKEKSFISSPYHEKGVDKFPRIKTKSGKSSNYQCVEDTVIHRTSWIQAESTEAISSNFTLNDLLDNSGSKNRGVPRFSFKKIRKTFKNVIDGYKELRSWTTMDRMITTFNEKGYIQDLSSMSYRSDELNIEIEPRTNNRNLDNSMEEKVETLADFLQLEDIYERKAKGQVAKALNRGIEDGKLSPISQVRKTLADIPFIKEDEIYPSFGSVDQELVGKIRYSTFPPVLEDKSINNFMKQSWNIQLSRSKELSPKEEHSMNSKGKSLEAFELDDSNCRDRHHNIDMSSYSDFNGSNLSSIRNKGENSFTSSELESFEEEQQEFSFVFPVPMTTFPTRKIKIPNSILDKEDRASPVSVLKGEFVDIFKKPQNTSTELEAQSRKIPLQNHVQEYENFTLVQDPCYSEINFNSFSIEIKKKLEYDRFTTSNPSEISCNEHSEPQTSSVVSKIVQSTSILLDDPKLQLDCINEVLIDIQKRLVVCLPWIKIIRPNAKPIPNERCLIKEVCSCINRHLNARLAITMDELLDIQLSYESWVNLYSDIESAILDMGDDILIDLMEECICDIGCY